ncbi:hypothetical protein [Candidatus Brachybacter algidus]|uniref:hypothetical protein n=1 Tax=Candidatus Brachybacter algidus TaxID=2982024 RepID=UPI001DC69D93|nr:hypothetical protein [Candidatus Brachybacter algidus]MBK6450153.1 hypothetical protein [Candidatus Brachybacter algidus]
MGRLFTKIKDWTPGSSDFQDIFDKAVHAFQQWKRVGLRSIGGVEVKYPPYIAYWFFAVLPLIEIQGDYYATNYYDRLKDFLEENNIRQNLRNKLRSIDELWANLQIGQSTSKMESWVALKNFYSLTIQGSLFTNHFLNVLTPKAIRKLPNFFYATGFIPKTFYQDEFFRKQLCSRNGIAILELKASVVEIIKKESDEIGQSIVETVKSEFNQWTGEEHEVVLKDGTEKKIEKHSCSLKLQFKVNEDGEIVFSYRVKYSSEPPPELKFDEFEDIYENENWSRTLKEITKIRLNSKTLTTNGKQF